MRQILRATGYPAARLCPLRKPHFYADRTCGRTFFGYLGSDKRDDRRRRRRILNPLTTIISTLAGFQHIRYQAEADSTQQIPHTPNQL